MQFGTLIRLLWASTDKARSCEGKVKYGHEVTAITAARSMDLRGRASGLEHYKCRHCEGWHIGHSMKGKTP